jgi:hypothetical protein
LDSEGEGRLVQLKADFENRPTAVPPKHYQELSQIKTYSKGQNLSEQATKTKSLDEKEKNPEALETLPLHKTDHSIPIVDPFSETVLSLLPDGLQHCPACHHRMALLVGMYGPYLKCPKCEEKGQIPYSILVETVSRLRPLCEKCGRSMRAVQFRGKIFPGCSGYPDCRYTEPWKALAIRLRQKDVTKG